MMFGMEPDKLNVSAVLYEEFYYILKLQIWPCSKNL